MRNLFNQNQDCAAYGSNGGKIQNLLLCGKVKDKCGECRYCQHNCNQYSVFWLHAPTLPFQIDIGLSVFNPFIHFVTVVKAVSPFLNGIGQLRIWTDGLHFHQIKYSRKVCGNLPTVRQPEHFPMMHPFHSVFCGSVTPFRLIDCSKRKYMPHKLFFKRPILSAGDFFRQSENLLTFGNYFLKFTKKYLFLGIFRE